MAAGVIVLGLLVVMGGVVIATVKGVTEQADQISNVTDDAIDAAADQLDAAGISTKRRWRMPGRPPEDRPP